MIPLWKTPQRPNGAAKPAPQPQQQPQQQPPRLVKPEPQQRERGYDVVEVCACGWPNEYCKCGEVT